MGALTMRTRITLSAMTAAAVLVMIAGLPATSAVADSTMTTEPTTPVVHTNKGNIRGIQVQGVDSYLGIPYAAAPVGALRWKPPQPHSPWSGVLATTAYGNRCPALPSTNGPLSLTEDCLLMNVQRPASTTPGARLPVYVFLHGGGLVNGSSNQHDGTSIVAQTGIIVVTLNYRLGVFGWMGHPALTLEQGESGNYGLQDQEAALRWVQRNIAAFGGDPGQVTIGGESSGAISVCALLTAPGARGLFSRAMMQSGACGSQSQSEAESFGASVAAGLGCTDPTDALTCLRRQSTQALLDAAANSGGFFVRGTPTLPVDPGVAIEQGQFARVPIVVGANRDEGRTFTVDNIGMSQAGYNQWLQEFVGSQADAVRARYPWPAQADQFTGAYLTAAVITDGGLFGFGGCTNRARRRTRLSVAELR